MTELIIDRAAAAEICKRCTERSKHNCFLKVAERTTMLARQSMTYEEATEVVFEKRDGDSSINHY